MKTKTQKADFLIAKTIEILGKDVLKPNSAEFNARLKKIAKVLESLSTQYGIDTHHQEAIRTYVHDEEPDAHEYAWETGEHSSPCATAIAFNILEYEIYENQHFDSPLYKEGSSAWEIE